jgi:multidrug efflux pump subunit AcrA (membrane-fusion protein)
VVTAGLSPGDTVVTTGIDRLRDGQVIQLARARQGQPAK